jgi:hypothetical protein
MTRFRRSGTAKGWDQLVPNVRSRQLLQAERAARLVIRNVTEISPNYSGRFRTRWTAEPLGPSEQPAAEGGFVPRLTPTQAQTGYSIRNNSPYAPEAMDLEPGVWIRPATPPVGDIVDQGERTGAFRGEVDSTGPGNAISTAERDWYVNYAQGGEFADDVKKGAQAQIRRPK